MKEILNEWRKFIKETKTLTLDYPVLAPNFLSIKIDESLLTEEKDPEAPSVEDLESKTPDFFKNQMDSMLNIENKKQEFEARIERDRVLYKKFRMLNLDYKDLDFEIKNYGKDPVTAVQDMAKNLINSIFGTEYENTEKRLERMKKEVDAISKQIRDILISTYNPFQREIFRAISVFTGGNFEQIRNPDTFDPSMAKMFKFVNDGIRDMFMPTKETYVKAKIILRKLAKSKLDKAVEAWRGFTIYEKDNKYPGLESYSVGKNISIPNLSSFSVEKEVAMNFSETEKDDQWQMLLYIPKMTTGTYVDDFSQYEDSEKEIIYFGDFKILELLYVPYDSEKSPIPFKDLQDLKNKKLLSTGGYIQAKLKIIE